MKVSWKQIRAARVASLEDVIRDSLDDIYELRDGPEIRRRIDSDKYTKFCVEAVQEEAERKQK